MLRGDELPVERYAAGGGGRPAAHPAPGGHVDPVPLWGLRYEERGLERGLDHLLRAQPARGGPARRVAARDASADPAEHDQHWWWVGHRARGPLLRPRQPRQHDHVDPAADVVVRLGRTDGDVPWTDVLRDVADRVPQR